MVWLLDTSRTQIFCSGKISIHRSAKIAKQNVSFRGHNSVWKASVTSYIILYGPEGPIEMKITIRRPCGSTGTGGRSCKGLNATWECIAEELKSFHIPFVDVEAFPLSEFVSFAMKESGFFGWLFCDRVMVEMRRIIRTWLFFDEECCEKYCLCFSPQNEGCEGLTQIYCVQVWYIPKASEIGCLGVLFKVHIALGFGYF